MNHGLCEAPLRKVGCHCRPTAIGYRHRLACRGGLRAPSCPGLDQVRMDRTVGPSRDGVFRLVVIDLGCGRNFVQVPLQTVSALVAQELLISAHD